jgi:hypothetical protein
MAGHIRCCLGSLVVLCLVEVTHGARIHAHLHDKKAISWKKGQGFLCMLKWKQASKKFTSDGCLVNLDSAAQMDKGMVVDYSYCVAKSKSYRMKVCNVKGSGKELRISYSERVRVPKACFRESMQAVLNNPVVVLEASMSAKSCNSLFGTNHSLQRIVGKDTLPVAKRVSVSETALHVIDEPIREEPSTTLQVQVEEVAAENVSVEDDEMRRNLEEKENDNFTAHLEEQDVAEVLSREDVDFLEKLRSDDEDDPVELIEEFVEDAHRDEDEQVKETIDDKKSVGPKVEVTNYDIAEIRRMWMERDRKARSQRLALNNGTPN